MQCNTIFSLPEQQYVDHLARSHFWLTQHDHRQYPTPASLHWVSEDIDGPTSRGSADLDQLTTWTSTPQSELAATGTSSLPLNMPSHYLLSFELADGFRQLSTAPAEHAEMASQFLRPSVTSIPEQPPVYPLPSSHQDHGQGSNSFLESSNIQTVEHGSERAQSVLSNLANSSMRNEAEQMQTGTSQSDATCDPYPSC